MTKAIPTKHLVPVLAGALLLLAGSAAAQTMPNSEGNGNPPNYDRSSDFLGHQRTQRGPAHIPRWEQRYNNTVTPVRGGVSVKSTYSHNRDWLAQRGYQPNAPAFENVGERPDWQAVGGRPQARRHRSDSNLPH